MLCCACRNSDSAFCLAASRRCISLTLISITVVEASRLLCVGEDVGAQSAVEARPEAISNAIGVACIEREVLSFALALWAWHEFIKRLGGREGGFEPNGNRVKS